MPEEYSSYYKFTTVRNPYERCFSNYWFNKITRGPVKNNNKFAGLSYEFIKDGFNEWCRMQIYYRDNPNANNHAVKEDAMTQLKYVVKSSVDDFIRLEYFDEEAKAIKKINVANHKLPLMRKSNYGTLSCKKFFLENVDSANLVIDYCDEDFVAFGYSRDIADI